MFPVVCLLSECLAAGTYTGRIIDAYTKLPVAGADVYIKSLSKTVITDNNGEFSFATDTDPADIDNACSFHIRNNQLFWEAIKPCSYEIYNIAGQHTGLKGIATGTGSVTMPDLSDGIYLLYTICEGQSKTFKIVYNNQRINLLAVFKNENSFRLKSGEMYKDSIIVSKAGYYTQAFETDDSRSDYPVLKKHYNDIDYLDQLLIPEAFEMMQNLPFNPTYSEVKSVKIVFSIPDGRIYYTNSEKYPIHFDFAEQVLSYNKGHNVFNSEQYTKNPNRIYYLASLNHFISSDIYTLDFFSGDELDCSDIKTVYDKIVATTFIGNKLRFYDNSNKWETCSGLNLIGSDELYAGQNYQPLNTQENYGYLKKIDITNLAVTYVGRHDIVLLNGIPNDIPVVAGIITTQFQTPLSHINVLSHNRQTPNMALRNGWTNQRLLDLENKLVYLKVSLDSFYMREASLTEAQTFWAKKEPQTLQRPKIDTLTTGIINLSNAGINSIPTIGGKAANFAEIMKIEMNSAPIPVPENAFAIPVYYYWQHMKKYGLDRFIANMLENAQFWSDASIRAKTLLKLQDSIKHCAVDTGLLRLVNNSLKNSQGFTNFRFRSSSNTEDIEGFNGAGLYDSYTGIPGDQDKTIEKAIRKTWASLWNLRAFEEREYFKIDQNSVAMAELVERAFPAEAANGVVITKNLFNQYYPAYTINVQVGEISVVLPTDNNLPDQILLYLSDTTNNTVEYVSHSTVPGMEGKTVMTVDELKELRKYCTAISNHYCILNLGCKTLDIEFKVDIVSGIRKIYIKQARVY
jgi:hypothetical protein